MSASAVPPSLGLRNVTEPSVTGLPRKVTLPATSPVAGPDEEHPTSAAARQTATTNRPTRGVGTPRVRAPQDEGTAAGSSRGPNRRLAGALRQVDDGPVGAVDEVLEGGEGQALLQELDVTVGEQHVDTARVDRG